MKKICLPFFCMFCFTSSQAQISLLDSLYNIAQKNSIYSADADWKVLKAKGYQQLAPSGQDSVAIVLPNSKTAGASCPSGHRPLFCKIRYPGRSCEDQHG